MTDMRSVSKHESQEWVFTATLTLPVCPRPTVNATTGIKDVTGPPQVTTHASRPNHHTA